MLLSSLQSKLTLINPNRSIVPSIRILQRRPARKRIPAADVFMPPAAFASRAALQVRNPRLVVPPDRQK